MDSRTHVVGLAVLAVLAGTPPAVAQQAEALEEVTVTARRATENLQDVPVSITAVSQEDLARFNVKSLTDLQYLVPSMSAGSGNDGRSFPSVSIRGVNSHATDGQGVITYLNEVALPQGPQMETGGGMGLFYDLENVQVLKGPQGTLFGKNAIGGAILYETRRPGTEFGGYVQGTVGDYDNREITAAVDVPLGTDKLVLRLAVNDADREGFTKSAGTANHPNGVDLDDRNYTAARATLRFQPSERVTNDLIYDMIDEDVHGVSQILTRIGDDGLAAFFFPEILDTLAEQQALGARRQVATNTQSFVRSEFMSVTDILDIAINDSVSFRNIAAYNRSKIDNASDWDGTLFPIIAGSGVGSPDSTPYRIETISEEAQLHGGAFGTLLNWTVGAIYQENPVQPQFVIVGELFGGPLVGGPRQSYQYNTGVYGQGTLDFGSIAEGLSFTFGYRHSWDHIAIQDSGGEKATFEAPSWTVSLDYQPSPGTLLYIASRRGYHAGGLNDLGGAAIVPYDEETVTDAEVGFKKDWLAGSMPARTNVALYYSDYDDFQTQSSEIVGGTVVSVISNSGTARVQGAELEAMINPTENLELLAQYAWLDFEYTHFLPTVDNPDYLRATVLANGPENRYSVGARYKFPIAPTSGELSFTARYSWQSETLLRFQLQEQDSYGLLNLALDWTSIAGAPIDASLFVTNATDELYAVGGYSFADGPLAIIGTQTTVYGEPRMYGLRLTYRFGSAH